MAKQFLRDVGEFKRLYIDSRTGIAWIADGSTGMCISVHPNIDITGSVRGMKNLGYWGKKDRTVRCNGFIYNIDHRSLSFEDDSPYGKLEKIVLDECCCDACSERRANEQEGK